MALEGRLIMDHRAVLQKTESFAREHHHGEASGHDWWHIDRVRTLALKLQETEGGDRFVIELAALLHDIADYKLAGNGDVTAGERAARAWLMGLGVDVGVVEHVGLIIGSLSWKGAKVRTKMKTLEGKLVQDADRLDGIGAIGIARVFAYGGFKGRALHDPTEAVQLHASFEEYRASKGGTINHVYERLLWHRAHLNTKSARRIAKDRHAFLVLFLKRFHREWEGKA